MIDGRKEPRRRPRQILFLRHVNRSAGRREVDQDTFSTGFSASENQQWRKRCPTEEFCKKRWSTSTKAKSRSNPKISGTVKIVSWALMTIIRCCRFNVFDRCSRICGEKVAFPISSPCCCRYFICHRSNLLISNGSSQLQSLVMEFFKSYFVSSLLETNLLCNPLSNCLKSDHYWRRKILFLKLFKSMKSKDKIENTNENEGEKSFPSSSSS